MNVYDRLRRLRDAQDVMVQTQLCAFQIARLAYVRERMNCKFDKDNEAHENKLLRLWTLTFPETPLEARITSQWSRIGFQGQDPGEMACQTLVVFVSLSLMCSN